MIEKYFPESVSNIIDYDYIKVAAKKYVEEVFVSVVKELADNLFLQTMDKEHLAIVSEAVCGESGMTAEEIIEHMNSQNVYHECEFVSEMMNALNVEHSILAESLNYYMTECTGYGLATVPDWVNTTKYDADDPEFKEQSPEGRFGLRRFSTPGISKSSRRHSGGDESTWMTGHFGAPGNVVIEAKEDKLLSGLPSTEMWLGTVCRKIPVNLYIEIRNSWDIRTKANDPVSQFGLLRESYTYAEEEVWISSKSEENEVEPPIHGMFVPTIVLSKQASSEMPANRMKLPNTILLHRK